MIDRTIYNATNRVGQTRLEGYSLTLYERASAFRARYDAILKRGRKVIGIWRDFKPGMYHAVDSRESWEAIWSFVTLRQGDTDREYFDTYTDEMLAFRDNDAEHVGFAATVRFGNWEAA